jgi:hypothetical protein
LWKILKKAAKSHHLQSFCQMSQCQLFHFESFGKLRLAPKALSITVTYQLWWWTSTLSPDAESLPFSKSVSSRLPITLQRSLIAPMVSFSKGSLVANLKNWARRSTRKEPFVAKQSRRTSQDPTTTDKAEQSQRTSSVAQRLATTVEVEQSQRTSSVAQHLATTAEVEQRQRTSFVA